jgi:flagellar hook assembly protein FlgD
VVPNPFSPLVLASRDGNTEYGARIRIHPESNRSAEVTLSAKIYTLDGELLRTLVDHKTVPKGPVDFYWDGKADGGRWARNGRYLLKVAVNATGSSEIRYTLKPIVVFR